MIGVVSVGRLLGNGHLSEPRANVRNAVRNYDTMLMVFTIGNHIDCVRMMPKQI